MFLRSKTGLLEGVRKPVQRQEPMNSAEFPNFVCPAPYTLRPFAGVYNPFPYGCSILCNHPADYEAKDLVKRAKDSWATEGKALLLPEEIAAIHAGFLQGSLPAPYDDVEDAVPEELFRPYTDTDSRPLTPAPTLASIMTKGSLRRCVTPDPIPTHILNPTRERTVLLLDLRRSHSQDILSWQGLGLPATSAFHSLSRDVSPVEIGQDEHVPQKKKISVKKKGAVSGKIEENDKSVHQKLQQQVVQSVKTLSVPSDSVNILMDMSGSNGEEDLPKRRGKHRRHRKKSGRDGSREPEEFQGLAEPGETQVSAMVNDFKNISARPSLTPGAGPGEVEIADNQQVSSLEGHRSSQSGSSFIDAAILKQLQRELDQEVIDKVQSP
ncbi:hypothetical protein B7P43_G12522 [Cryptotermes secundus]|uniref:Uncharacterized protein n=1 Tax=Cryptotermes secundus TaxID=105785 RepID=A0A2J7PU58_9NEOP|nr:hypothetical protein B7P43_G12522 [Cryptotermes secundus]